MIARKKPIQVNCLRWTGENCTEVELFVGKPLTFSCPPTLMEQDTLIPDEAYSLVIPTLEGGMTAIRNDIIIKGVHGECYPCKPDIFDKTYDVVSD